MNDVLIISPSGKLYGSERVLLDYIDNTSLNFDIAVPGGSDLQEVLRSRKLDFLIIPYNPYKVYLFYSRLVFLFLSGRYKKVYLNEAAHVKYTLLLARLFTSIRFVIHVRIAEDTKPERWSPVRKRLPANLRVVTISEYLSAMLGVKNMVVPDPFIFSEKTRLSEFEEGQPLHVGIVGRIAESKGIQILPHLLNEIANGHLESKFIFHLYGELSPGLPNRIKNCLLNHPNIVLHGYIKSTGIIYKDMHAVLHLSQTEPLGRIFFEAVDYGIPFLGINAGGIGETSRRFDYRELLVNADKDEEIARNLVKKLLILSGRYNYYVAVMDVLREKMKKSLSVKDYCQKIDEIIAKEIKPAGK